MDILSDSRGYPIGRCIVETVMTTTLAKWGNSQGMRIPKEVCELLGVKLGSRAEMSIDAPKSQVTFTFEQPERKYRRSRRVSMEELCAGWHGGKVGEEWGGPDVGAEVVR